MNVGLQSLLLTSAIGLGLTTGTAGAAPETVFNLSVAPSHCQAFTPGATNTIRNRVSGAENIGTAEVALACSFENIGSIDGAFNDFVSASFYNNSTASMTINCTNLNGWFGAVGSTINKSVTVAAAAAGTVSFTAADTPSTTDIDLGSFYSGINCGMPANAIMTRTAATWLEDYA